MPLYYFYTSRFASIAAAQNFMGRLFPATWARVGIMRKRMVLEVVKGLDKKVGKKATKRSMRDNQKVATKASDEIQLIDPLIIFLLFSHSTGKHSVRPLTSQQQQHCKTFITSCTAIDIVDVCLLLFVMYIINDMCLNQYNNKNIDRGCPRLFSVLICKNTHKLSRSIHLQCGINISI